MLAGAIAWRKVGCTGRQVPRACGGATDHLLWESGRGGVRAMGTHRLVLRPRLNPLSPLTNHVTLGSVSASPSLHFLLGEMEVGLAASPSDVSE